MNTFQDPGPARVAVQPPPAAPPPPQSPSDFARQSLKFIPDPLQAAVLDSTAKRGILNCTRQWGKSTVLAAKAVHHAFTRPGSLVLVTGPAERQSRAFLRKATTFLSRLGIPRRGDGDNPGSFLLPNGSCIIPLPGIESTTRCFSASMILIDEAARVDDSLYYALLPMLAVADGDLWLLSTPAGKRGFFYNAWAHGDIWDRHSADATQCPRISTRFLEEVRSEMPGPQFRQEFLCEFVDGEDTWFKRDLIEAALSDTEEIL